MSAALEWTVGAVIVIAWLLVIVPLMVARHRARAGRRREEIHHKVERWMDPGCQHKSVPWPVMSGGDLVAWLCDECREPRKSFTCPRPSLKYGCTHEDMTEIRVWGGGCIQRYCSRCGQQDIITNQLEAFFTEQGHRVPFLKHTQQGDR